jgi:hypothetical protein
MDAFIGRNNCASRKNKRAQCVQILFRIQETINWQIALGQSAETGVKARTDLKHDFDYLIIILI